MSGVPVSIFAYGPTGSGKTFTILGDFEGYDHNHSNNITKKSGIIPRTFHFIFEKLKEHELVRKSKITVELSCLEIYNEDLYDLLEPSNTDNIKLIHVNKKMVI
jgi:Kinesin motor domain